MQYRAYLCTHSNFLRLQQSPVIPDGLQYARVSEIQRVSHAYCCTKIRLVRGMHRKSAGRPPSDKRRRSCRRCAGSRRKQHVVQAVGCLCGPGDVLVRILAVVSCKRLHKVVDGCSPVDKAAPSFRKRNLYLCKWKGRARNYESKVGHAAAQICGHQDSTEDRTIKSSIRAVQWQRESKKAPTLDLHSPANNILTLQSCVC